MRGLGAAVLAAGLCVFVAPADLFASPATSAAEPTVQASPNQSPPAEKSGADSPRTDNMPAQTPPPTNPDVQRGAQIPSTDNSNTVGAPIPAPATDNTNEARLLARNFLRDQRIIWTQPLHLTRGHLAPLLIFAGVTAALIATDQRTTNALPNSVDQIADSGAVSRIGAAYTTIGLAGGLFTVGHLIGNRRAAETGFLSLEALADTLAVAGVVKEVTRRERPSVDNGRGRWWDDGSSFPSGHSIMSWGIAEVIAHEYKDKPLVRIGAYSLATLVSLSRYPARQHFLSDIVAGSVAGFLIGRYVSRAHHDPERRWELMPIAEANPSSHTYAAGLTFVQR